MSEPRIKPERIYHASQTQFIVARHWGECGLNGAKYHYDAVNDVLIRDDVWQEELAASKDKRDAHAKATKEKWLAMQKELF